MKEILLLSVLLNPFISITDNFSAGMINNSGNTSLNNILQLSYEYGCDYSVAGEVNLQLLTYSEDYPVLFYVDINVNFTKPVETCNFTIQFNRRSGNNYYYPAFNIISEYCTFTYTNNSSYITVNAYNTSYCKLRIMMSYKQVNQALGFTGAQLDVTDMDSYYNEWVNNGQTYISVYRASVNSGALTENPNYTTQLTSLMNNTDTLEQLLTTIANNSAYLNTINTNIADIENYLNAINTKLDNIDNTLDNITWQLNTDLYKGWTQDYTSFNTSTYGYLDAGYYVLENPSFINNNVIYKLTIGIGINSLTMDDITLWQYWENDFRQFTIDSYMLVPTRYQFVLYFIVNEKYHNWPQSTYPLCVHINKRMYKYSAQPMKLEYIDSNDIEYWTLYKAIHDKMVLDDINSKLSDILSVLNDIDVNSSDLTDKNTVDNFYERLKQNLVFPANPTNDRLVPILKEFISTYGQIINMEELSMFKWGLLIMAIFVILRLVLL